jgi:hypothetical protein
MSNPCFRRTAAAQIMSHLQHIRFLLEGVGPSLDAPHILQIGLRSAAKGGPVRPFSAFYADHRTHEGNQSRDACNFEIVHLTSEYVAEFWRSDIQSTGRLTKSGRCG